MTLAPPIRWVHPSAESTAAPEAARPGEWSELPAIERASGELELTARSQAFVGGLASQRPDRATLAPLRGGRSLEAPHGLVRGIARVLDGGRLDGPELTAAPRTRSRRRRAEAHSAPETEVLVETSPTQDDAQAPVATPSSTPTAQAAGKAPARRRRPGKDIAAASPLPDVLRRAMPAVPAARSSDGRAPHTGAAHVGDCRGGPAGSGRSRLRPAAADAAQSGSGGGTDGRTDGAAARCGQHRTDRPTRGVRTGGIFRARGVPPPQEPAAPFARHPSRPPPKSRVLRQASRSRMRPLKARLLPPQSTLT